ncbi:MAG: hypothetical protein HKN32_00765 [Flavobacteriales bacterium]|nr:hypothetical protein [Flavobacteriales bacterium]
MIQFDPNATHKCVVKTMAGFEELLYDELTDLGIQNITRMTRAVSFDGETADIYRVNYYSRFAIRVLVEIHTYKAFDDKRLHSKAMQFDWSSLMTIDDTFAIDSAVHSDFHTHSQFAALRVKDAIADFFMEKQGKRPSVDIKRPDFRINVHIEKQYVTLSLDSSGASLHKRGYRTSTFEAPLNEVLAAGMIKLSGWDGSSAFWDPMCGSGTLVCEAAMMAYNIAPQVNRDRFGFKKWSNFNQELWDKIREERPETRDKEVKIFASDLEARSVSIAKEHLDNLRLSHLVKVEQQDIFKSQSPAEKGTMIINPPYGVRLEKDQIEKFYDEMSGYIKHKLPGWDAWIFTSNRDALKRFGLRPSKKITLYNGALQCAFWKYEIFAGKRKEHKA